jgi:RNA polymerase sigma-70 factor (ECF subfamily)
MVCASVIKSNHESRVKIRDYNNCVEQNADGVFRFILKNIKNEDKAKDVVQEAFLKLWEKHENIEAQKAKSYLFTTAYHCMIDMIRKDKRVELNDEMHRRSEVREMNPPDLQEILHQALDQLPEIQKNVVLLRDYEGYNYEEIGEICNLNPSQVKVYIYRARLSMKKFIGKPEMVI